MSLVDHIFQGTAHFTGVYDEVTDETGIHRVLKDCFSRDAKCSYFAGDNITKEILYAGTPITKSDYATPKTLWNLATDTFRECSKKKALAIATPYLATNGGKPPSGNNIVIDYYNHILDGMWLSQQKAENTRLAEAKEKDKNAAGEEEEAKVEDVDVNRRPEDYMFSGFLAFALLGPYVPEGFESNRLLKLFDRELDEEDEDGSKKSSKKSLGRRNSQQEEAQNTPMPLWPFDLVLLP